MIRSKDINNEVKILDEQATVKAGEDSVIVLTRNILKAVVLAVKLLRDIRTNQVLDLENRGIKLVKDENQK